MTFPRLYTSEDLAVMWCRLNAGRHPTHEGWGFNPENIAGAMALIVTLVGPAKCLTFWRKESFRVRADFKGIERRSRPRGDKAYG